MDKVNTKMSLTVNMKCNESFLEVQQRGIHIRGGSQFDVGVFTEKFAKQTTRKTRSICHRSRKNETAPQTER